MIFNLTKSEIILILSSQASLLLLQFIYSFIKDVINKQKMGISKEFANLKLELQSKLDALRENVDSNRCYLSVLHNGGYYFTGESIKKSSVVFESTTEESLKNENQNVPVSVHLRMLNTLFTQDYYFEKDTTLINDTLSKLYNFNNIQSYIVLPIFKKRPWYWIGTYPKKMVAFLIVSWDKPTELNIDKLSVIQYYHSLISDSLTTLGLNK